MDRKVNYTAKDFDRYFKSEMTDAEMHAIEKAALEDPFVQDAMDGYPFTQTAEKDLEELRNSIQHRNQKKRSIFPILKYAAIAILVLGALLYSIINTSNKNTVESSTPVLADNRLIPSLQKDSNLQSQIATMNTADTPIVPTSASNTTKDKTTARELDEMAALKKESLLQKRKAENAQSDLLSEQKVNMQRSNSLNAIEFDSAIKSDVVFDHAIVAVDKNAMAENNDIIQEKTNVAANAVRQNSSSKRIMNKKFSATENNKASPLNSNDDLVKIIKEKKKNNNKILSGWVTFSFEVGLNGEPTQFNVEDRTCVDCEDAAKNILQSSKWLYSSQRVWYTVNFD